MNNKRRKAIITLLIIFLMGFVIGLLAGLACSGGAARDAVIEDEEAADEVVELVQKAVEHKPEAKESKAAKSSPKEII